MAQGFGQGLVSPEFPHDQPFHSRSEITSVQNIIGETAPVLTQEPWLVSLSQKNSCYRKDAVCAAQGGVQTHMHHQSSQSEKVTQWGGQIHTQK